MQLDCPFEELDTDTRNYLLAVRRAGGRGAPGVYAGVSDAGPWVAIMVGPVVAFAGFVFGLDSPKPAWASAMLMTAGMLVGGWLVMYALRRWASAGTPRYPGRFVYFDPIHAYDVRGERVRVVPLHGVAEILAVGGDNAKVRFRFEDGRGTDVSVPSIRVARRVEQCYAAVGALEQVHDGPWAGAPPAFVGAAAAQADDEEDLPKSPTEVRPEIDAVPTDPQRGNRASGGGIALLAIPAAAAVLFVLFWQANLFVGDDLAFESAKSRGAPGLRGYLLDDRNARHREEARALLADLYDPAVNKLRTAPAGTDPTIRTGMVQLVESLRTADQAVFSLDVNELAGPIDDPAVRPSVALREQVADSLARSIGPELVAFVAPVEGKPAHVDVRYHLAAVPDRTGRRPLTILFALRTDVSAEPVTKASVVKTDYVEEAAPLTDVVRDAACKELTGGYSPPGGEF